MKKINYKLLKFISAPVLVLFFSWYFFLQYIMSDIETITYDWRAKIATEKNSLSKHDSGIILLAADDDTTKILENYPGINPGRWPWPRSTWGDIVNFISKGNPKAIVFDLKFEGNTDEYSDKYFADAIKNKNVIIATALSLPGNNENVEKILGFFDEQLREYDSKLDNQFNKAIDIYVSKVYDAQYKRTPLDGRLGLNPDYDAYENTFYKNKKARDFLNNITFYEKSSIYEELTENAAKMGVINLKSSENVVFRHHVPLYRLVNTDSTNYLPSLPLAAVLSVIPEKEKKPFKINKNNVIIGKRVIPVDNQGRMLLNWHGPGGTYKNIPVAKVILSSALERGKLDSVNKHHKISPDYFRDKIVVIGQTSAGTDLHPTPMASVYPGPEIITTATDNILNDADTTNPHRRKFILKSPPRADILITILLCLTIGYAMLKINSNSAKLQVFIFIILLYIALAIIAFIHPQLRIWLNMTYSLTFMFLTGISAYAYINYRESRERKQVEQLFGKFVSPQILEKLLSEKAELSHTGQRKVMTVLFSDIRGFTTLSEKNTPDEVIAILNEYITEMVEVILSHNGTLDKYIGDAIMAFYNDPVEMPDHALRAVKTAISMKEKLAELNKKWAKEGKEPLDIGIGINTGEMIVGHMGSPRLVDYTVIGDNVNLASRIESLTKQYNSSILISESTYNEVKNVMDTCYRDEVLVKGRSKPVKIYEIK